MKEEIMKAIQKNELYDFIANNYWNMSKEELKDVCLELIWTFMDGPHLEEETQQLLTNLSERWSD